jgi:hypothetical protein
MASGFTCEQKDDPELPQEPLYQLSTNNLIIGRPFIIVPKPQVAYTPVPRRTGLKPPQDTIQKSWRSSIVRAPTTTPRGPRSGGGPRAAATPPTQGTEACHGRR